jgi:hypothetical protein
MLLQILYINSALARRRANKQPGREDLTGGVKKHHLRHNPFCLLHAAIALQQYAWCANLDNGATALSAAPGSTQAEQITRQLV